MKRDEIRALVKRLKEVTPTQCRVYPAKVTQECTSAADALEALLMKEDKKSQ